MNLIQLKYFAAAVETRSFTKTAERFYITQTAVTQQIRALEDSLNCTLFDRSTRPIRLTPAGKVLYTDTRKLLAQMDAAAEHVRDASNGTAGTIQIGFLRGYERSELSATVRRFHRMYPNVFVTFARNSSDHLAQGLLEGTYDIIFTWDSTDLKSKQGISSVSMEQVRLVAALYAGHPLADHLSLSRADLKGEDLLYLSPSEDYDSVGDAQFMTLYRQAGYEPHIIFRAADIETILMMVSAEEGISILPEYFTKQLVGADNLVFVPLRGASECEEITALWKTDNCNPALNGLTSLLTQNTQEN